MVVALWHRDTRDFMAGPWVDDAVDGPVEGPVDGAVGPLGDPAA